MLNSSLAFYSSINIKLSGQDLQTGLGIMLLFQLRKLVQLLLLTAQTCILV